VVPVWPQPAAPALVLVSRGEPVPEASLALAKLYQITKDPAYVGPLERALDFLVGEKYDFFLDIPELIDSPGISMHANCGLTFALDPMRHALSNIEITEFTARAGMPVNSLPEFGEIDLWVLVDGRIRFHKSKIRTEKMFDILSTEYIFLLPNDGV